MAHNCAVTLLRHGLSPFLIQLYSFILTLQLDLFLGNRPNLSFDISLPEQKGKTINISATGVYFEIVTDNIDAFAPGSIIPLQISAVDTNERALNLSGEGLIIREDVKEKSADGNRLCVAVQFTEKLNVNMDKD